MAAEPTTEPLENVEPPAGPPTLPGWPWWTAPLALVGALVLTAVASLVVDLPALALGVSITSSHTPPGLIIADTVVQDLSFVIASVYCAHLGARAVRSWQFGLRRPTVGWGTAVVMVAGLVIGFILLDAIWGEIVHPGKEKLLEQLGTKESTGLLILSAGLTCVIAPICEEFLFRGYIFTALRGSAGMLPAALITGLLFGGVHATSAPVADLLPLATLGFGLCLLYRYTGSLYPGIAAHALNNSLAFAGLAGWQWWQGLALIVAALVGIATIVFACKRAGLIAEVTGRPAPAA
jgi:membrane protease YdiL (CAAX protease family)